MTRRAHCMIGEAIAGLRAEKAFSRKHINRIGNRLHQGGREGPVICGNQGTDITPQSTVLVLDATNLGRELSQTCMAHQGKLLDGRQIRGDEGLFQFLQCRNKHIQMLEGRVAMREAKGTGERLATGSDLEIAVDLLFNDGRLQVREVRSTDPKLSKP